MSNIYTPTAPLNDPIAESNHFIVLNEYVRARDLREPAAGYQSEKDLEDDLIRDLQTLGYEYLPQLNNPEALLSNARTQLEKLNNLTFTDSEWERFLVEYLDKPGTPTIEQTRRVQVDHICDFKFDDGHLQNVYLVDKDNVRRNRLQVIHQFEQKGTVANRYDVTLLVNGIPMVQVELKRRGVSIREAFYQVHRYSKESFNADRSLFKYLQIFVISNGTDTRYFANTTKRNKDSFDFTMNWALEDNSPIKDLQDFTATFFQQNTLLQVLLRYTVLDVSDHLLIMRPYQIAATERILWKVRSAYMNKVKSGPPIGRLCVAHHWQRKDPDELQGGATSHPTRLRGQSVFRGRPQRPGLSDHEGVSAFPARQREWQHRHPSLARQLGEAGQQDRGDHAAKTQHPAQEGERATHLSQALCLHLR